MFTEVRDYEATNPGILTYRIAINVATVIALCKSIINYAHICIGQKYKNIKYDCASVVHDFAYILKKFPNEAGRIADDLSIHGIPMTFSLKKVLQAKLKKENSHTLFLIEHNGALYGGFLLFGQIPLAYRIIQEWKHEKIAFATSIDYGTQKHIDINIKHNDFNTRITIENQDKSAFRDLVNNYFPRVVEDCIFMDMKKTLINTLYGGGIENFFPIKDKIVIQKILKERLRIMFRILTKAQGNFAHLFDSDISDKLTIPIIDSFFKELEIKELNKDTYSFFTYSSVQNIMTLVQNKKFIQMLNYLSDALRIKK